MAINDILSKIMEEAENKAASERKVVDGEIQKMKQEAASKADDRVAVVRKRADEKAASIREQAKILANMENKSKLLRAKRGVIDEVYHSALSDLNQLEESDYVALLTSMFQHVSGGFPEGELIVASGKKSQTESAMSKAGVHYSIRQESRDFKGGFILVGKKSEINLSFPYLMEHVVRPETELDVANILF